MSDPRPHSIVFREDLCTGCTACVKACPTGAIRLRDGKARILDERCIDCGACIRGYAHAIALVGPEVYGQFGDDITPEMVLQAILGLGFNEVFDVTLACEELIIAIRRYLAGSPKRRPMISFTCPAVVRLIAARYPNLLPNVVPLRSPMGVAARHLHETRPGELGLAPEEIGLFYITPCPAKVTRIRRPLTDREAYFAGAIALSDVYGEILAGVRKVREDGRKRPQLFQATGYGLGWGGSGGEARSLLMDDCLYVDGMPNVLKIFEEIERGEMSRLSYLEVMACTGGCVGGPLTVDNVFVARNKIQKMVRLFSAREANVLEGFVLRRYREGYYHHERDLQPRLIDPLDANPLAAIKKMKARQLILDALPGIDCGACGAPTCRALAEDVVQERAERTDCVFVLFEQANEMAKRVVDWTGKLPTSARRAPADPAGEPLAIKERSK